MTTCQKFAGILIALLLCLPMTAWAADITVDTTVDELNANGNCSLREAIEAANTNSMVDNCGPGDPGHDRIILGSNTYEVDLEPVTNEDANADGDLDFDSEIEIEGNGPDQTIIEYTSDSGERVIHLVDGDAAGSLIEGVTILHGNDMTLPGGGGIRVGTGASLNLIDVVLLENSTGSTGGGLRIDSGGAVIAGALSVLDNEAGNGGGIAIAPDGAFLANSLVVENNSAPGDGGGIYNEGAAQLTDAVIDANISVISNGGGIDNQGDMQLNQVVIAGNDASLEGGGLRNFSGAALLCDGLVVAGNHASDNGGGIANEGAIVCENGAIDISDNAADDAGGGLFNDVGSSFLAQGVVATITDNEAADTGGGIHNVGQMLFDGGSLFISRNVAADHGGGVFNGGPLAFTAQQQLVVGENTTAGNGGGIFNNDAFTVAAATDVNAIFDTNDAGVSGGGLFNDVDGQMSLQGIVVQNNTAFSRGGGIYNDGQMLGLTLYVDGNVVVSEDGGGVYNRGELEIVKATISRNLTEAASGLGNGGGIAFAERIPFPAQMALTNVTISANDAPDDGGGVFVALLENPDSAISITNATVVDNAASSGGGISITPDVIVGDAPVEMTHTIVANNAADDCVGEFTSNDFNLIENDTGCIFVNPGNDLTGVDPMLGALLPQEPTDFFPTHLPLVGSDAIDGGDVDAGCIDDDQRGTARPQDGDGDTVELCDIGAIEVAASTLCGNGVIDPGEDCDDMPGINNPMDNLDDCLQDCTFNVCGDGHLNMFGPQNIEECEDGNTDDGDGCSSTCENEPDFENECGDGVIVPADGEECDDGNTEDGDGCSSTCEIEEGPGEGDPTDPEGQPIGGCIGGHSAFCNQSCTASDERIDLSGIPEDKLPGMTLDPYRAYVPHQTLLLWLMLFLFNGLVLVGLRLRHVKKRSKV